VSRNAMVIALFLLGGGTGGGWGEETVLRQGDYEVAWTPEGLTIRFQGIRWVCGSRLTLFQPGYVGKWYEQRDLRAGSMAQTTVTDRSLTVTDSCPEVQGRFTWEAVLEETGVRVSFHLRIDRAIDPSPCELTLAMFPPELFAGGEYAPLSLLGEREGQPLPVEKPQVTGPGTLQLSSDLLGLKLRGNGIEGQIECLAGPRPSLYDMRSRDFPEPEKVYWLLYQWPASRGEVLVRARFSARRGGPLPAAGRQAGQVLLKEGDETMALTGIALSAGAHAVEKAAAQELQRMLARMGGGELPLREIGRDPLPDRGLLYLGQSPAALQRGLYTEAEMADLGPDGFVLRAHQGNLLVAGGGYRGTVYAVYRLLETLGCRFYAEELEVVPQGGPVTIPASLHITDRPAFEWRASWITQSPMKAGLSPGEWEARVGEVPLPKMMAIPPGGFWHHTMGFLMPAAKWYDSHPEYFALIRGERRRVEPAVQQYCLSNPNFRRDLTQAVLQWMEENPDPLYYPVHYGDVGNFCECKACQALYAEKGSVTDAVIWFLNQIAQEVEPKHPDKFLTILAYWGTRRPPVNVRPARNLLIVFCAISECQARPWSAPINRRLNVQQDLERWIALHPLGPKGIITFEYPCTYHYVGYTYPTLYAFAENLRYYQRLGLRGVYVCGLTRGHLVHLYSYVIPRLMWNPQRELAPLLEEFTQAWYGRAGKAMYAYVDTLHRAAISSQSEGVMDCHAGPGQRFFRELLTPELLDQLYGHFAEAEAQAESDVVRRRIGLEKWGLLFTDLFLHGRAGSDLIPEATESGFRVQVPREEDYRKRAELLRLTQLFNRPWEVAPHAGFTLSALIGFEPTASPWWECPRIRALLEDPAAAYRKDVQGRREALEQHLVALENEHLKVILVPSLGGRLWRLYAKSWGEDLLWRGTLPWHLLESGANPAQYVNLGGYEEYAGEEWASPGWAEKYDCKVADDRQSATLSAALPSGLVLRRTVTLLPDRPGVAIASELHNPSPETVAGAALRSHPQFRFGAGQPGLALRVRGRDGRWSQQPLATETWFRGDQLPQGAWGVTDPATGASLINEFDPAQVRACYVYVSPAGESYNLELFSPSQDLPPGATLRLEHRYVLEK
jgi:hypothetical protein